MKIATTGLNIPAGKIKYEDPIIIALEEQVQPKKVSPFYCEFLQDDYENADIIAIMQENLLDLLIHDIDKLETRRSRSQDPAEQATIDKVLIALENNQPVCNQTLTEDETEHMRTLAPLSIKPTLIVENPEISPDDLIPQAMQKARLMFFYTSGKQEVRSWLVPENAEAQICAGTIHSDLARGFIKAEIISAAELLQCHSFQEAGRKGLTKLVDRSFQIPPETVLEIRFNV